MVKIKIRKKEYVLRVYGSDKEQAAARKILTDNRIPFTVFVEEGTYLCPLRKYVFRCSLWRYTCLMRLFMRRGIMIDPRASINLY